MKKWYLQTWFICLIFLVGYGISNPSPSSAIMALTGIILTIGQYIIDRKMEKEHTEKQREQIMQEIENYKMETEQEREQTMQEIENYKMETEQEREQMMQEIENYRTKAQQDCDQINAESKLIEDNCRKYRAELAQIQSHIEKMEKELLIVDTSVFVDENISSEEYNDQISLLKVDENALINSGEAVIENIDSKKLLTGNFKQIIRCFNAECSVIISSVTTKNIESSRGKLERTFEGINNIFKCDNISLSPEFLKIKLKHLNLRYCYEKKKELEKEQQKAIKEQMMEEEKVRREIEKEKAKIEKEETQFKNEISKLMTYLQKADTVEKQLYVDKINELENKLKLVEKDKENVLQREQNTRAGFVYVISNIGSFGEDVYKIGMTRRLEPMDRVKELGDASVPFEFDVHAMIFSEDAPGLENILHTTFKNCQVNKVNPKKEFFRVKLDQIQQVVTENYNATVTFTKIAEAKQYRESLLLEQKEEYAV